MRVQFLGLFSAVVPWAWAAAQPPAEPAHLKDALAVINLAAFPMPAGKSRESSTVVGSHFTVAKGKVADVVAFYREQLGALGWKEEADPKVRYEAEQGAQLYFCKNGYILYASVGISPADQNLNAGLFFVGNVDARTLPQPPGAKVVDANPARIIVDTMLTPDEVRAYYRKELEPRGWKHYFTPQPAGLPDEVVKEMRANEVHFLKNGISIDTTIMVQDGKTRLFISPTLVPVQLPVPADAKVVQFSGSRAYLFCRTALPAAKAKEFFHQELAALGWKASATPQPEEKGVRKELFAAEGKPSLRLNTLVVKESTVVEITELPMRR